MRNDSNKAKQNKQLNYDNEVLIFTIPTDSVLPNMGNFQWLWYSCQINQVRHMPAFWSLQGVQGKSK